MSVVVAFKYAANPQDASVNADGTVDWSRAKASVSEYDPVAIQVGRQLADTAGTELVGISVGTSALATPLAKKAALARGLDRAVLLADDATSAWNCVQVGAALAQLVRRCADAQIVLAGDASIDENARIMPALVAAHLGWPCLAGVTALVQTASGWEVTQSVADGTRVVAVTGPVVVAMTSDAVVPKVPGMKDILAAAKKPVQDVAAGELDLAEVNVEVAERAKPASQVRKNQLFRGEDAATQLVAALRADGVI